MALALLLHLALIAIAAAGLSTRLDKPAEPLPIMVQLVPAQRSDPLPAPPAPQPPAPAPPAAQKKTAPKPHPLPKPVLKPANPRAPITPEQQTPQPSPPAPPAAPVAAAPVAPATPPVPAAPPAPAKTTVSIPASYAASNRKPVYPAMSRRYEEQGTVVLRVLVKADGTAGQIDIKSSSGYPLLDESAQAAVQGWRFQPATRDGKPVADWFLIPIPFTLQN